MVSRTRKHHGRVGMTYICNDCGTKYKDNNVNNEFFIPCPNCNSLNCSIDKLEQELMIKSNRRKERELLKLWYEEHNTKYKASVIKSEFITKKCLSCNKEMILKNIISMRKRKFCCKKCSEDYRKSKHIVKFSFDSRDEGILDRIELLKKRLSESEQDELDGIKEELEELTKDSSEYKCECAFCNNKIDIKEEWHYTNRRWILERIYELNTNNDPRHHIIPRKYGINNDETNKIFLCSKCHDYVEIKTEEWIQSGKRYDIEILKSIIINNGFEDEYLEKKEPTNMYIL